MKKLLIIALALMLALSLCACKKDEQDPENNTGDGIIDLNPGSTGDATGTGTGDTNADNTPSGTDEQTTVDLTVPTEETFTDLEQTVFIVADVASVRSETYVSDSTLVAYASKDAEFKSIAYSANWFKIEYVTEVVTGTDGATETKTQTCYLHKSVACVKDLTAQDLEQPITVTIIANALNVRSYYDFDAEDNLMCTLKKGDEVTAVAKGNGWYKIQLSDDAEGNPVFGYISSNAKYVSVAEPETTVAEDTTAAEETTVAEDATTEEATTEEITAEETTVAEETTAAEEATTEAAE